jgi:hypothetical protein
VRKTAEEYYWEFQAGTEADAAMSLLRSRDALLHLALMAARLGEGQVIDGQSLAAMIGEDLAAIGTAAGAEDGDAGRDPEAVLRRWTRQGWVHRGIDPDGKAERYRLTAGAQQAVQQAVSVRRQSSTATQSALAMVMDGLRQVAADASPDPRERIAMLREQIAVLEAQLAAAEAGEAPPATSSELADRVVALAHLMDQIPADVARYGERMHANTAVLLQQSLDGDAAEFAGTLERMFAGHDVIASSPEGQAFQAFTLLIGRPSERARLEADIAEILDRVPGLPGHLASTLGTFIDRTWQRVQEVEGTRRAAFRRISHFVRGGDAAHYRGMRTRITEAQAAAAGAFLAVSGRRDTGLSSGTGRLASESAGRLRLAEGAPSRPDAIGDAEGFTVSPVAAGGLESVDMEALRAAVARAMDAHGGIATLPEVLAGLPGARTGDVIGLWHLAARYGEADETATETVTVATRRGPRSITLPYLAFTRPLPPPGARPRHAPRQAAGQLTLLEDPDGH